MVNRWDFSGYKSVVREVTRIMVNEKQARIFKITGVSLGNVDYAGNRNGHCRKYDNNSSNVFNTTK